MEGNEVTQIMQSISEVNASVSNLAGMIVGLKETISTRFTSQTEDINRLRAHIDELYDAKNKAISMVHDLETAINEKIATLRTDITVLQGKTANIKEDQLEVKDEIKEKEKAVVDTKRFKLSTTNAIMGTIIAALTVAVAFVALSPKPEGEKYEQSKPKSVLQSAQ